MPLPVRALVMMWLWWVLYLRSIISIMNFRLELGQDFFLGTAQPTARYSVRFSSYSLYLPLVFPGYSNSLTLIKHTS